MIAWVFSISHSYLYFHIVTGERGNVNLEEEPSDGETISSFDSDYEFEDEEGEKKYEDKGKVDEEEGNGKTEQDDCDNQQSESSSHEADDYDKNEYTSHKAPTYVCYNKKQGVTAIHQEIYKNNYPESSNLNSSFLHDCDRTYVKNDNFNKDVEFISISSNKECMDRDFSLNHSHIFPLSSPHKYPKELNKTLVMTTDTSIGQDSNLKYKSQSNTDTLFDLSSLRSQHMCQVNNGSEIGFVKSLYENNKGNNHWENGSQVPSASSFIDNENISSSDFFSSDRTYLPQVNNPTWITSSNASSKIIHNNSKQFILRHKPQKVTHFNESKPNFRGKIKKKLIYPISEDNDEWEIPQDNIQQPVDYQKQLIKKRCPSKINAGDYQTAKEKLHYTFKNEYCVEVVDKDPTDCIAKPYHKPNLILDSENVLFMNSPEKYPRNNVRMQNSRRRVDPKRSHKYSISSPTSGYLSDISSFAASPENLCMRKGKSIYTASPKRLSNIINSVPCEMVQNFNSRKRKNCACIFCPKHDDEIPQAKFRRSDAQLKTKNQSFHRTDKKTPGLYTSPMQSYSFYYNGKCRMENSTLDSNVNKVDDNETSVNSSLNNMTSSPLYRSKTINTTSKNFLSMDPDDFAEKLSLFIHKNIKEYFNLGSSVDLLNNVAIHSPQSSKERESDADEKNKAVFTEDYINMFSPSNPNRLDCDGAVSRNQYGVTASMDLKNYLRHFRPRRHQRKMSNSHKPYTENPNECHTTDMKEIDNDEPIHSCASTTNFLSLNNTFNIFKPVEKKPGVLIFKKPLHNVPKAKTQLPSIVTREDRQKVLDATFISPCRPSNIPYISSDSFSFKCPPVFRASTPIPNASFYHGLPSNSSISTIGALSSIGNQTERGEMINLENASEGSSDEQADSDDEEDYDVNDFNISLI